MTNGDGAPAGQQYPAAEQPGEMRVVKACPACGRLFDADAGYCPVDGTQLLRVTEVPVRPADDDPRIGQLLLERYQVRRVVADGGMGRVYEGLDLWERRHVALKVLHPEVAADPVALERFWREYEVSRQLPHQHIVEVLDFTATRDGSYALVMEFLQGEELRNTLRREGVLPPERVVRMVAQLALGLDQAHSRKLVHRDLKPDNVFLCQTGQGDIVKILDFGSVKDKADHARKLTVIGTTIGSPYYMAPEQAQGLDTLDHRADVWALGAIVYEAVTGRVPFGGKSGPNILLEILTREPLPVTQAAQGQRYPVPPALDRVLQHALRKSPAERIASVGALADAIGRAYGLDGCHRDWAFTPQDQLGARIQQRLPELLRPSGGSAGPAWQEPPCGVPGNFEILADPFAAAAPTGGGPQIQPLGCDLETPLARSRSDGAEGDRASLRVPTTSYRWLVLGLLGIAGLLAGAVLILLWARSWP